MPIHRIRLSALAADGTIREVVVREIVASDIREAMAIAVSEQDGWFTVEALDELAPSPVEPFAAPAFALGSGTT